MQRKGILSTKESMPGGSCERGVSNSSKSDPSLAQETYEKNSSSIPNLTRMNAHQPAQSTHPRDHNRHTSHMTR